MAFNCVFLVCISLINFNALYGKEVDWDFTLERIDSNTTNPSVLDTKMRVVRIDGTAYGLTGTFSVKAPLDDSYKVKAKIYRSSSGSSQYKLSQYELHPTRLILFLNTVYKNLAYDVLKKCSNLPQWEGTFVGPFQPGEYFLNACKLDPEMFPVHVTTGFYKIIFEIQGPESHLVAMCAFQIYKK